MTRPATNPAERLLTRPEVAKLFRVDPETVSRWARAGQLPCLRTPGGTRRFPEAEILAIRNQLQIPTSNPNQDGQTGQTGGVS